MLDDIGRLILRLTLGGLILFHGVHKLLYGIAPIEALLAAHGLPGWLAFGVYLGEVAGPLMVIVGLGARAGAALIAIDMIFAIALTKGAAVFSVNAMGGMGAELELLFLGGALALALLGSGSLGLSRGCWH